MEELGWFWTGSMYAWWQLYHTWRDCYGNNFDISLSVKGSDWLLMVFEGFNFSFQKTFASF